MRFRPTAAYVPPAARAPQYVREYYSWRSPELMELRPEVFAPAYWTAFSSGDAAALRALLEPVGDGVFRFALFRPEWCQALLEETRHYEAWAGRVGLHVNRPNSMNNFGLVLDDFGLDSVLQALTVTHLSRLASLVFPGVGFTRFDSHHGFLVEYELGRDTHLGFHVDDSELTLNVCLGEAFEGGDLFFRGRRCALHQSTKSLPEEDFDVRHVVGEALLHLGRHRHGAKAISAGKRVNMILWARSSEYRLSQAPASCPTWCGMNPALRQGSVERASPQALFEGNPLTLADALKHAEAFELWPGAGVRATSKPRDKSTRFEPIQDDDRKKRPRSIEDV